MARKIFTPEFLDAAKLLLAQDHASFNKVGKALGVNGENLRVAMMRYSPDIKRGKAAPPGNAKPFDHAECIALYAAGHSVKALAERYNVQRSTISTMLDRNGIALRGRSEAMFTRMANTDPEKRKQLCEAAHNAVRGKAQSNEHRENTTVARFVNQTHVGRGEKDLASALGSAGVDVVTQAPVNPYNIDLLCFGRVAVEIHTASCLPQSSPYHRKRIENLLNRDIVPVYLCGKNAAEHWHTIANQLVPIINQARGLPPGSREYWVIRGTLHRFAIGTNDRGQFACVPAPPRFEWKVSNLQW